jgi:hypothetical protein
MTPTTTTATIAPFELMYHKNKHPQLFETLENAKTGLHNLQNYIPMYRRFFALSESNHNTINLNHRHHVASVAAGVNKNTVIATITSSAEDDSQIPVFIKYSPLLDPIKYLSGKYDMTATDLLVLPKYDGPDADAIATKSVHQNKMHDINNSSYVDSFFTYLNSRVLHEHGFVHCLDFYGSHLANQDEFTVNIYDELDYFGSCDFFLKNRNELFRLDETPFDYFESASNKHKSNAKPANVRIGEDLDLEALDLGGLDSVDLDNYASELFVPDTSAATDSGLEEIAVEVVEEEEKSGSTRNTRQYSQCSQYSQYSQYSQSSDSCSSRSSDDDNNELSNRVADSGKEDEGTDSGTDSEGSDSEGSDSEGSDSEGSDEVHNAHIFNFPVHAILMEKCDNTLDSLMCSKNELTEPEWAAALMQVIMTLIAYQHMFAFTHNDLHTNNIMFVKTDKKFLHYLHKGVYYRVPTHGRIMKIIDFGRAVYKYRGQTMCSDSFDRGGDAATQYNCEPYLNPKKPRLDPNPSFDLCRLACSLFDYFVEDIRDEAECAATLKESRVASMVVEWLKDDKGRNVLYKKNGDERYPEFKLYKMIARTVHGAVPHEQLHKPMFAHFAIQRKQINGKPHIMNIDALPSYTQAQAQTQSK